MESWDIQSEHTAVRSKEDGENGNILLDFRNRLRAVGVQNCNTRSECVMRTVGKYRLFEGELVKEGFPGLSTALLFQVVLWMVHWELQGGTS